MFPKSDQFFMVFPFCRRQWPGHGFSKSIFFLHGYKYNQTCDIIEARKNIDGRNIKVAHIIRSERIHNNYHHKSRHYSSKPASNHFSKPLKKGEMNMKKNSFAVTLDKNPAIKVNAIPGHFTTSQFHITHYLDLDNLKSNARLAREAAKELAGPYLTTTHVDTIVCLEGMEVVGAFMAEELAKEGTTDINSGKDIYVVTPISNYNRKLMFQSSMQEMISDRDIIVLVSSISSGLTLYSALECLSYYGGKLAGISALFSAYPERHEHEINSLFTGKDVPGYQIYSPSECPICRSGRKLDGIIVQDGYINI